MSPARVLALAGRILRQFRHDRRTVGLIVIVPIVVMAHNPDSTMVLPRGAAALAVAAHTHGGQVRVPWLYRRAIPCQHPFDRGLHDFAPMPVFVTTGLGEGGLPIRLLNPPVIDVLEIG